MAFIKEKFEDSNIDAFMAERTDELVAMLRFMSDLPLSSLRYELVEAENDKRSYKCYFFESSSAFRGYGQFAFQVSFDYQTKEIAVMHLSGVANLTAAYSVPEIIKILAEDFFADFFLKESLS
ncbi:hypothetical protein ACVR1G_00785 [Streptococcus dentasini]